MNRKVDYDRDLAARVLNLRRAGVPFDVIADELNLTATAAKGLFDKAIGETDTALQRALEVDRLDRLHAAMWPRAVKGELEALDRVLRISERREKVTAKPKRNDHKLRKAFDASVSSSTEVGTVDSALVEAGRKIADRVDEAVSQGEGQELTKALYLVPHMMNVLREMLATPASRANAGITAKVEGTSKLAELRALHGKRSARDAG